MTDTSIVIGKRRFFVKRSPTGSEFTEYWWVSYAYHKYTFFKRVKKVTVDIMLCDSRKEAELYARILQEAYDEQTK